MEKKHWTDEALCKKRGVPTSHFFDDFEKGSVEFKTTIALLCESCPVKQECFDDAVATKSTGFHGGEFLELGRISGRYWRRKFLEDNRDRRARIAV